MASNKRQTPGIRDVFSKKKGQANLGTLLGLSKPKPQGLPVVLEGRSQQQKEQTLPAPPAVQPNAAPAAVAAAALQLSTDQQLATAGELSRTESVKSEPGSEGPQALPAVKRQRLSEQQRQQHQQQIGGTGRLTAATAAAAQSAVRWLASTVEAKAEHAKEVAACAAAGTGTAGSQAAPEGKGKAAGSGAGVPAAAAGQRGAAPATAGLAERAAQTADFLVQQAVQAFQAADMNSPSSMLRPLQLLAARGHGGQTLQEAIRCWSALQLGQQQMAFQVSLVAAGEGAWQQLDARLRAALDLTT